MQRDEQKIHSAPHRRYHNIYMAPDTRRRSLHLYSGFQQQITQSKFWPVRSATIGCRRRPDMESHTASDTAIWSVPQCAFQVEYSLRALDEIRLLVVDAFFSVPRGGAEIGGVLLGKHEGDRLVIQEFKPLDCEHAYGP